MNEPRLYVPVSNRVFTRCREDYLIRLRLLENPIIAIYIDRTFLAENNRKNLAELRENLHFLSDNGFEALVWIQSFGFGIPLEGEEKAQAEAFMRITDLDGRKGMDAMCPTCTHYRRYYADIIRGAARAGAKRIMLDDDLCLSVRPGLGCACENHLRLFREKTGKDYTREELKTLLFTGKATLLRRQWMDLMGETLMDFCRFVRSAADEIDPNIQMGFCAGYTSWDFEGVDALTLTKILAGGKKPFLRLTGAPYWLEQNRFPGQKSAQIVEFTRMQRAWCEGDETEIFTENDSYPRPRHRVPAAILETFDFMMCADSRIGQLKYLFDYYSKPSYEEGYLKAHLKNAPVMRRVQSEIAPMRAAGVSVWEEMRKVRDMTFPNTPMSAFETMQTAFCSSSSLLSSCAIPTVYGELTPVTAAFSDAGRTVPLLKNHAYILDLPAALALKERGADTGLLSVVGAPIPFTEYFVKEDDPVLLDGCVRPGAVSEKPAFFRCAVNPKAEIESVFRSSCGEFPGSYFYQNSEGQTFLVFLFDGASVKANSALSCSYYRQAQIQNALTKMGAPLPASVSKYPEFYMIVKREQDTLAVAYCNFSMDAIDEPVIRLSEPYARAEFIGISGTLEESSVRLSPVAPHAFGAVILRK